MPTVKERMNRINASDISNYAKNSSSNKISFLKDDNSTKVFSGTSRSTLSTTQSKVRKMIQGYGTESNQKALNQVSKDLYVQSQQYQRLINYYANMPTFSYILAPSKDISKIDETKISKEFVKSAEFMSRFNVKYNFNKILKSAMQTDVFYGYVIDDGSSVLIQKFPNEICKISSVSGGVFNFVIDLDEIIGNEIAEYYPEEIQNAVSQYSSTKKGNNKSGGRWYEVSQENGVCIKINEGDVAPIPPFAGTFDSVYDISAFKDLRNDKAELQNYKMIVQRLETRSSSTENNDFVLDMDMTQYFDNALNNVVPENVGVVTSPMDIDVVNFDKDTATDNNVEKATKDFWDNAGVSQILFSSDNKTSQGIAMSIKTDEQVVFSILNQFERWVNRYMILNKISKNFKCVMIDVTNFSRADLTKEYIQNSQYGFPVKMALASLSGIEPIAFSGLLKFENEILKLPENMTPLSSSFNTSGKDIVDEEGGRPTNKEAGESDSDETQRAKDKPSNEKVE